jgi:hypothetical protein
VVITAAFGTSVWRNRRQARELAAPELVSARRS